MRSMDSVLNIDDQPPGPLHMARALLTPKPPSEKAWPALAAAALFAVSGLGFAYAAITAPQSEFKPVPVVAEP